MKNEIEPVLINEEYLRNKIHTIRGQKVMLDSDLAMLYGYSTKRFNEQVLFITTSCTESNGNTSIHIHLTKALHLLSVVLNIIYTDFAP